MLNELSQTTENAFLTAHSQVFNIFSQIDKFVCILYLNKVIFMLSTFKNVNFNNFFQIMKKFLVIKRYLSSLFPSLSNGHQGYSMAVENGCV